MTPKNEIFSGCQFYFQFLVIKALDQDRIRSDQDRYGTWPKMLVPDPYQMNTVKAGNFVTFFAQINFFLENSFR
jgi:hypothetical protein